MLSANKGDEAVFAPKLQFGDRGPFSCPECEGELVLKQGAQVIWHFAHRAGGESGCSWSSGETIDHMKMKFNSGQFFEKHGLDCAFEKRVVPDRRADVWLPGLGVVVECQHSRIDFFEILARTHDYNVQGYGVLWVFGLVNLAWYDVFSDVDRKEKLLERPVGKEVLRLHKELWGQVPVMDSEGDLRSMHLQYDSDLQRGWRLLSFRPFEMPIRIRPGSSEGARFAFPSNSRWWPKSQWKESRR